MFLLSIGLLKIRDGLYVSLADSQAADDEYEDEVDVNREYDEYHPPPRPPTHYYDVVDRPAEVMSPEQRIDEELELRRSKKELASRRNIVCACRLGECNIADPLVRMGKAFVDMTEGFDCLGLNFESKREVLALVTRYEGSSYVPADHDWVRVERDSIYVPRVDGQRSIYVPRVDAQRMALALLNMPWSSQGYIIGGDQTSVSMEIFKPAAMRLRPVLGRLQDKVSLLDLTPQDKQSLSAAIEPVLRRLDRVEVSHDIQIFRKLYELNEVLLKQGSHGSQAIADQAVAILSITNEEFRNIVHMSVRNFKELGTPPIDLDLKSMTLKVPSALGVKQHFQVDWDVISNTTSEARQHETLPVNHTAIVLACLRSFVLCAMLLACGDAVPLLDLVGSCGEFVYID